jgi:hypothetical protein
MSGQVRLGAVSCTLLAATALVLGCGGQSAREEDDRTGGRTARGGSGGFAWAGGGRGGNGGTTPTGGRLTSDFVDPGCPDPPPPEEVLECDPLGDSKDCPLGFGCYPFVTHPSGDGCEPRIFGATCRAAGAGTQGSVCGSGTDGCAPGFMCVVGLQPGRRCAKICTDFDDTEACGGGMICGETDVEGYGVCG